MGLLSKLTAIINGPYGYRAGPDRLGIGTENLALVLPGVPVQASWYDPSRDVRRSPQLGFATQAQDGQSLPDYDLRQGGVYLSGAWELSGLVDMSS
jgi:hypothetical protein